MGSLLTSGMVGPPGFYPGACRLRADCSTNELRTHKVAERTGLAPVVPGVTSRCLDYLGLRSW